MIIKLQNFEENICARAARLSHIRLEEEKCQVYSLVPSSEYHPLSLDRCLHTKGEQKEDMREGKEEEMICLGMPREPASRESSDPLSSIAAHLTRIFLFVKPILIAATNSARNYSVIIETIRATRYFRRRGVIDTDHQIAQRGSAFMELVPSNSSIYNF